MNIASKLGQLLGRIQKKDMIIFLDLQFILIAYLIAFFIRFDLGIPLDYLKLMIYTFPVVLAVKLTTYIVFRLHRIIWRYTGVRDLMRIIKVSSINNAIYAIIFYITFQLQGYPRSVILLDWGLFIIVFVGVRIFYRYYFEILRFDDQKNKNIHKKRCLIIGAGDGAESLIRAMINNQINYNPPTCHKI
jgi:FlaA1/EpsC-like NDP-sugar epimerase